MAKTIKIERIRADGHVTVTATDDDGVSVRYSTAIPPGVTDAAEIRDLVAASWPEAELAARRGDPFRAVRAALTKAPRTIAEPIETIRERVRAREAARAEAEGSRP